MGSIPQDIKNRLNSMFDSPQSVLYSSIRLGDIIANALNDVLSVNGLVGNVILTTDNVAEGPLKKYYSISQFNIGNLDFGQSFTIEHAADPDFKRIVEVTQHNQITNDNLHFISGIDLTYENPTKIGIYNNTLSLLPLPYISGMVCNYWFTELAPIQAWAFFDFNDQPINNNRLGLVLNGSVVADFTFKNTPSDLSHDVQIGNTLSDTLDNLVVLSNTILYPFNAIITKENNSQLRCTCGSMFIGAASNNKLELAQWENTEYKFTLSHVAVGSSAAYEGSDRIIESIDRTGNNHNAILHDCTIVSGQVQRELILNGTSSYGEIANYIPVGYSPAVSAWGIINFSGNPSDSDYFLLNTHYGAPEQHYFYFKLSPVNPNDIQIGTTLSDTLDNLIMTTPVTMNADFCILTRVGDSIKFSAGSRWIGSDSYTQICIPSYTSIMNVDHVENGTFVIGGTDAINPNGFNKTFMDSFTIKGWVQRNSGFGGDVIGLWNEATNRRSWRVYIDNSGYLKMDLSIDGSTIAYTMSSNYPVIYDYSITSFWIMFNSDTQLNLFINGNSHSYYSLPFSIHNLFYNDIDPVLIGAKYGVSGIDNFFSGKLSDMAIIKNIFYFDSMYSFYQTETMGQHLTGYDVSQGWYATTTDNSQIDTSNMDAILGINISNQSWSGNVLALVSTDGRTTWKKWNGSVFQTISLSDIKNLGNAPYELQNLTKTQWDTIKGNTFDIALCLSTNVPTNCPQIDYVYISALVAGRSSLYANITKIDGAHTNIFNSNGMAYDILVNLLM